MDRLKVRDRVRGLDWGLEVLNSTAILLLSAWPQIT